MVRKTNDKIILQMLEQGKLQKEIAAHFGVSPVAICKRLKRILPPAAPESFQSQTSKEQSFVMNIAEGKSQTQSALNSYDVSSRSSAKALGTKLMAKPDIKVAVADIMQSEGLTKTYRVKKLKRHIDNADPNVSLKGLDQSWKLDGSYAPEKVEIDLHAIHADIAAIKELRDKQKESEDRSSKDEDKN
jgi:predicted transcriptional regulator